jgi:aminoglycoside N3'-acetyltransferase
MSDQLKTYRVTYRDPDPCAPNFTCLKRAYDKEHAETKFIESCDGDDWQIVRIDLVRR